MEQKYIQEAFDTKWVVPLGPNVDGFEEDLRRYFSTTPDPSSQEEGSAGAAIFSCGVCVEPSLLQRNRALDL